MWIVYNSEDSPSEGWAVKSEQEAVKYCEEHDGYSYKYVGWWD